MGSVRARGAHVRWQVADGVVSSTAANYIAQPVLSPTTASRPSTRPIDGTVALRRRMKSTQEDFLSSPRDVAVVARLLISPPGRLHLCEESQGDRRRKISDRASMGPLNATVPSRPTMKRSSSWLGTRRDRPTFTDRSSPLDISSYTFVCPTDSRSITSGIFNGRAVGR